jgi:hypothetical protein
MGCDDIRIHVEPTDIKRYALIKPEELASLRAQLAASQEREAQLAAALENIRDFHEASMLHREKEWINDLAGAVNAAIYPHTRNEALASRDSQMRREGALWVIRRTVITWEYAASVGCNPKSIIDYLKGRGVEIEAGEVKP